MTEPKKYSSPEKDAFGLAVLIGAGFSLVGVLIVARFMPARDPGSTITEI